MLNQKSGDQPLAHWGPGLVLLAAVVSALLLGPHVVRRVAFSRTDAQLTAVRDTLATDPDLARLSVAFERVARVVEPGVVHIRVLRTGVGVLGRHDPPLPAGNGSGWVYRHAPADGSPPRDYVLTNQHVVAGGNAIKVRFVDGREYDATLVGVDRATDVAVLDLDAGPLHAAPVADTPVSKGQLVFAFGSPLAFDFSVSQGIVSADGRQLSLDQSGRYESYIQTDAAINPGNSGGPLTDIHGRVVGMNFAIANNPYGQRPDGRRGLGGSASPDADAGPRGFLGLGFAIPVAVATDVADRLIEDGTVRRGFLGVKIATLTRPLARAFGLPADTTGVLVNHALAGSPAAAAGLQPGDVITAVGARPVRSASELRYEVSTYRPGDPAAFTVLRPNADGSAGAGEPALTLRVALAVPPGEADPTGTARAARRGHRAFAEPAPGRGYVVPALKRLGVERLHDPAPDDADDADTADVLGPHVTDVRFGSHAAAQGLGPRSILTHVNRQRITHRTELEDALARHAPHRPLLLTFRVWDGTDFFEYLTRFAVFEAPRTADDPDRPL